MRLFLATLVLTFIVAASACLAKTTRYVVWWGPTDGPPTSVFSSIVTPGMYEMVVGHVPASTLSAAIHSAGFKSKSGGGGYFAQWAMGYSPGGSKAPQVIANVTYFGTIATIDVSPSAHNLVAGTDYVRTYGWTPSAYNGRFLVQSTPTASSFTIDTGATLSAVTSYGKYHYENAALWTNAQSYMTTALNEGASSFYIDEPWGTPQTTNTSSGASVTFTTGTPGVVNWAAHGQTDGATVNFSTTGTLPTGLTPYVDYYVINSTTNSFNVSATSGGSTIAFGGAPSGAQTGFTSSLSATTAASIAYNVEGFNKIRNFIHTNFPGVEFGLSIGEGGGAPLHKTMLDAGLQEDVSTAEYYNCCSGQTTEEFNADGQEASYPAVKTSVLIYSTSTLCAPFIADGTYDYIEAWNVAGYGGWIGPRVDSSFMNNVFLMAATKSKSFCYWPYSEISSTDWTWVVQTGDFTLHVSDRYLQTPSPAPPIDTCDYRVYSGSNAIYGLNDPSVTLTRDWTSRTCNGTVTITVGAGKDCNYAGVKTCLVMTRARSSQTSSYNATYTEMSVSF